jgi:hypothetical protein
LNWIAWSPGNGHSILIGKDNILGMGSGALLSEELIDIINRKGFHCLSQVQGEAQAGSIIQNWKSSDELGLIRLINTEWSLYRRTLINNGIHLQEKADILKWTGGDCSGHITVKNVYLAVENRKWNEKLDSWKKALWNWNCPLKIKLFTWLMVENKILSWENLQHRGFNGPGICNLCKMQTESTHHLFMECAFTLEVWRIIKSVFNFTGN